MPFEFVYRRRTRNVARNIISIYFSLDSSIFRFLDIVRIYRSSFFSPRSRLKCRRSFGKESRTNPAAILLKSGYTYTIIYIEVICIARDRWHQIRSCNELKITDRTNQSFLSFFSLDFPAWILNFVWSRNRCHDREHFWMSR